MDWAQLLTKKRFYSDGISDTEIGRSDFHRDCDRIIFSSSFRRLGKKTQVHPLATNDHVHTRLTHSIEVSSVGRSLGYLVGLKIKDQLPEGIAPENIGEIVQAACLAHDIGNPPFGHAGEDAIRSWFTQPEISDLMSPLNENERDDLLNFEGNAQGFRVVTRLEYYKNEGGMRLTNCTLGAMLKYPWTSLEIKRIKKFGAFQSDKKYLQDIAQTLGLFEKNEFFWCRHPLAFLSEAADDICYRILDLEDAHEMKILKFDEIVELLKPLCENAKDFNDILSNNNISNRRKISYIRGKAIGAVVYEVAEVFKKYETDILGGNFQNSLLTKCDNKIISALTAAKRIATEKIFNHPRKIELEIGAYTTLGILLRTFCYAVKEKVQGSVVSFRGKRVIDMMGLNAPRQDQNLYEAYLSVLDYISGMTDDYATYLAKQIGGYGK